MSDWNNRLPWKLHKIFTVLWGSILIGSILTWDSPTFVLGPHAGKSFDLFSEKNSLSLFTKLWPSCKEITPAMTLVQTHLYMVVTTSWVVRTEVWPQPPMNSAVFWAHLHTWKVSWLHHTWLWRYWAVTFIVGLTLLSVTHLLRLKQ